MSDGTIAVEPAARAGEPDGAPRIETLDILRGIAILGILFMNVNDMGQSFSGPDIRHLGWALADRVAWWAREILADGTARAMLEMLFGAGMVILTERIAAAGQGIAVLKRYYWRNIVLWLFGLVHMFILLWPGDILHSYGIAALVAFWFRRLPPRWLILIGLLGATSQLFGQSIFGVYQTLQARAEATHLAERRAAGERLTAAQNVTLKKAADDAAERARNKAKHNARVATEDKERSGTTADWAHAQLAKSVERLGIGELFTIWEAAGTMLIGAALFRLGIVQGERGRAFYLRLTLAAYAFGLTQRAFAAYAETRFEDLPRYVWAADEFARLATTLGHIGIVNLLLGTALGARLLHPFAAAGRTALTIYICQTLICLWLLFPPFGFALYGKLTWMPMMLVSAAIDLLLLWLATLYVRRFAIAPVEWAWRSIVERRRLPLRRAYR